MDASRWPETIAWQKLSSEQRNRSTRLWGILKTAFVSHARTAMLISTFCEGVNLHRMPNLGHEELWMRGQGFQRIRIAEAIDVGVFDQDSVTGSEVFARQKGV